MGMVQEGIIAAARAKFFPAKPCDYCKSTPALLFCPVDTAFMCITCDAVEHDEARAGGKHGRVWLCEVCEQVPAAVTCKADAASLCVACDGDIHSANTLAGRHDRVPVIPFHGPAESVVMMSAAAYSVLQPPAEDGYVPDSWVSKLTAAENGDSKSMEFFFQDPDQFLDFDHYQIPSQPFGDSIVTVQTIITPADVPVHDHPSENHFRIDFTGPNISSSHTAPSLSHSLSSSSMEIGVVPDGGSFSEISHPVARNLISSTSSQVVGMDREARVLRYREKRKNRKFEKTVRYASRKAYAESRPRIKGRFAKLTESEPDTDRIYGAGAVSFIADARYGVVPSF